MQAPAHLALGGEGGARGRGGLGVEGVELAAQAGFAGAQVRHAGAELVGTVRLWTVRLGRERRALMLGPLAVDDAWRGHGVGARLMEAALERAGHSGEDAVILVGDPDYYRRFRFTSSHTSGLWLPGPVEPRRFLARELRNGALAGAEGPVSKLAA